jgi:translation initiation factor IF-1
MNVCLNDKYGYQIYVSSLKKTVRSHGVHLKPEQVCTSSVVETGLENAAVEDLVTEKRQENDTLSQKSLEVETEEGFSRNTGRPIRTVKQPIWMKSGDYILSSVCSAITGGGNPSYWEAMNSAQEEE